MPRSERLAIDERRSGAVGRRRRSGGGRRRAGVAAGGRGVVVAAATASAPSARPALGRTIAAATARPTAPASGAAVRVIAVATVMRGRRRRIGVGRRGRVLASERRKRGRGLVTVAPARDDLVRRLAGLGRRRVRRPALGRGSLVRRRRPVGAVLLLLRRRVARLLRRLGPGPAVAGRSGVGVGSVLLGRRRTGRAARRRRGSLRLVGRGADGRRRLRRTALAAGLGAVRKVEACRRQLRSPRWIDAPWLFISELTRPSWILRIRLPNEASGRFQFHEFFHAGSSLAAPPAAPAGADCGGTREVTVSALLRNLRCWSLRTSQLIFKRRTHSMTDST